MARTAEQKEKLEALIKNAPGMIPLDQTKSYAALIQEYGLIIRNNKDGKESDAAKKFREEHPDFTEALQLVSILEHFRNAKFNVVFAPEQSAPLKNGPDSHPE